MIACTSLVATMPVPSHWATDNRTPWIARYVLSRANRCVMLMTYGTCQPAANGDRLEVRANPDDIVIAGIGKTQGYDPTVHRYGQVQHDGSIKAITYEAMEQQLCGYSPKPLPAAMATPHLAKEHTA